MTDVPAHVQRTTVRLIRHYPDHQPRQDDPHYKLFEVTRQRMKRQGLLTCAIGDADCDGQIELHHSHFEFAYVNDVDLDAANKLLGLHLSDEEFAEFIEGPGNLEPLCKAHHTGVFGVHLIPVADWDIVRAHTAGTDPVQVER